MAQLPLLKVLADQEMADIHVASLRLLAETGVQITHQRAREVLAAAGAKVDKTDRVYFPAVLVEQSVKQAPRQFLLAARDKQYDLVFPHPDGGFYSRTGTGSQGCIDLESGACRYVEIKDAERWVQVSEALPHIDIVAIPTPMDTPYETKDVYALQLALKHTQKHIMIQPYSSPTIPYLCQMVAEAGGGKAVLRERPIASVVTCSTAPLAYKDFDIDIIFAAAEYGLPLHVASLCNPGGSAPVTVAGGIVQANAEILAGIVMVQCVCPGLPVIGVTQQLPLNMANGIALQTSVEAVLGNSAGVQMTSRFYGLPSRTYSFGSDALFGDSQSLLERAFLSMSTMLAGADILSTAGSLECVNTISLRLLVADNDLLGMLKYFRRGIAVDEDTLALDCINEVLTEDSSFILAEHTLRHCRDAYMPRIMDRQGRSTSGGKQRDLLDRAKAVVEKIISQAPASMLAPEVDAAVGALVTEADAALVKK